MNVAIFELTNFKEYIPWNIDIVDKIRLVYNPVLAPTTLKMAIEPALTEEELYQHMKDKSHWDFSYNVDDEFYKKDCVDLW